MKNISLLFVAITTTILLGSCSKDGAQGPEGPAGAQGIPGTANVIYSTWFGPTAWTNNGTNNIYFNKAATGITQAIIDQGAVLAYVKFPDEGGAARPLPTVTFNGQVIWNYMLPGVGTIRFTANPTNGTSNFTAFTNMQFRYVIIPGGQAGNRMMSSSQQTQYNIDELKSLSYEEVIKLLNIPEAGGNTK
jgi:hypothetical protein